VWLDATLSYLHYSAMFLVFGFLTVEVMLVREPVDARAAVLLRRSDLWYVGSAIATLATGIARLALGAKGMAFYTGNPVFRLKLGLFVAVLLVSVLPTRQFMRWRVQAAADPRFCAADDERRRIRRLVMVELHLLAFVPLAAVLMARGIGSRG
jgi:putative membrane protein